MDCGDVDDDFEGIYQNGHWEWNEISGELVFISDSTISEEDFGTPSRIVYGSIEFKDEIDLLEQQKFKRRYQRIPKTSEDNIVTLQDVKDVVLFSAPMRMLSPEIIKVLHLPITERFIRALIFYCQYYLQTSDEMSRRILELKIKVRTIRSFETELTFRENLEDLRLLVAKEYCSMITGGAEFKNYHHMGPSKKTQSLTKKESILFESVVRICIQIVWLALGLKSLSQIELEVHRLCKSQIYNVAEHRLKMNNQSKMTSKERFVLFGHCVHYKKKVNSNSPLINEVFCEREIDYHIFGLGVIKFDSLSPRLRYMERVLVAPENLLVKLGISLGILGLPRSRFDTMLKEIKGDTTTGSMQLSGGRSMTSRSSRTNAMRKSFPNYTEQTLYADIILPEKEFETCNDYVPDTFPEKIHQRKAHNDEQRRKWLGRISQVVQKRAKMKILR